MHSQSQSVAHVVFFFFVPGTCVAYSLVRQCPCARGFPALFLVPALWVDGVGVCCIIGHCHENSPRDHQHMSGLILLAAIVEVYVPGRRGEEKAHRVHTFLTRRDPLSIYILGHLTTHTEQQGSYSAESTTVGEPWDQAHRLLNWAYTEYHASASIENSIVHTTERST